jgi:hypothetical protein
VKTSEQTIGQLQGLGLNQSSEAFLAWWFANPIPVSSSRYACILPDRGRHSVRMPITNRSHKSLFAHLDGDEDRPDIPQTANLVVSGSLDTLNTFPS